MKYVGPAVLVIVMLFTTSSAFAMGLGLGVKLGYNSANFYGDSPTLDESSAKGGLCGGVFKSTGLLGLVAIQPELLYTQKGSKIEGDYQGQAATFTWKLDYLEVPLLVKLTPPIPAALKPSIYAGPVGAFKLSHSATREYNETTEEYELDDIKSFDYGAAFGISLDLGFPVGKLVFDVRYTRGMASIDDSADPEDIKNQVFSFTVGYSL